MVNPRLLQASRWHNWHSSILLVLDIMHCSFSDLCYLKNMYSHLTFSKLLMSHLRCQCEQQQTPHTTATDAQSRAHTVVDTREQLSADTRTVARDRTTNPSLYV